MADCNYCTLNTECPGFDDCPHSSLSDEEETIASTIYAARQIQTFLWGKYDNVWSVEEWRRMFRKRVAKIDAIDQSNPHAAVELKKRLLQQAALSIALMGIIQEKGITWDAPDAPPSNLPEYAME
jgi:hypothetical protein